MSSQDKSVKEAVNLSKNSSGDPVTQSLAPRSVGGFTLNFCRNPLCASFSLPPILHSAAPEHARGKIKKPGEDRAYICQSCGQSSRLKSNIAIVQEYARLKTLNRGTKREYCANPVCSSHRVPVSLMPSAYRIHGKSKRGKTLTAETKDSNRTKSHERVRPEHVFGAQTNDMGGTLVRTIGLVRTQEKIGLENLVYSEKLLKKRGALYYEMRRRSPI